MATIFILEDGLLSTLSELEEQLTRLVGERYPIRKMKDLADLQSNLTGLRQALVVFSASITDMVTVMDTCRIIMPGVAFMVILDGAHIENFPVLEMDCHVVTPALPDFVLLGQLSAAIRQSELLANLADFSQIDEVTNLFNRRYFMQRLSVEISMSRRHLSPLCCVVVGVNLYQMYLDSYGYSFINALLRFVADKISGMVRYEDVVARIGDGEISILLARSTEKGAKVFTSRLVHALNTSNFKYGTYEEEVTVCAGVAGYPLPDFSGADADMVVRYARHALHQARSSQNEEDKVQLFSEIRPTF
jgi:diguanylate cyclase (GGDEF)-like protein